MFNRSAPAKPPTGLGLRPSIYDAQYLLPPRQRPIILAMGVRPTPYDAPRFFGDEAVRPYDVAAFALVAPVTPAGALHEDADDFDEVGYGLGAAATASAAEVDEDDDDAVLLGRRKPSEASARRWVDDASVDGPLSDFDRVAETLRVLHNLVMQNQERAREHKAPTDRAGPALAGSPADRRKALPSAYSVLVSEEEAPRVAAAVAAARRRKELSGEAAMILALKSIKSVTSGTKAESTTMDAYYSHIRRILKVVDDDGQPMLPTPDGYCEFLAACHDQDVKCSHEVSYRMRSALKWFWDISGLKLLDQQRDFMERVQRGYCCEYPQAARAVKGDISLVQLGELRDFLLEKGHDELINPITLQWAMALRGGQLGQITIGQMQKLDINDASNCGSAWNYGGGRHKLTQGHKSYHLYENHICAPELNEFLTTLMAQRRAEAVQEAADARMAVNDVLLFPNWSRKDVNAIIQEAARKYAWGDLLNYSGQHCLRHGALTDAMEKAGDEGVVRRGAQVALSVRQHYSEPHTVRLQRATANAKRAAVGEAALSGVARKRASAITPAGAPKGRRPHDTV